MKRRSSSRHKEDEAVLIRSEPNWALSSTRLELELEPVEEIVETKLEPFG
ncbi:hypothetical protein HPP92_012475 [Vanilla planifolia]|uniref:Uncharacterized protein n=1 Tax=Vanilla planifolia TaxID=51239 RepID=A0A835QQJ8_VANPL|nr:hypothetical protein HPP92_012475 [Vanilla planifolia]